MQRRTQEASGWVVVAVLFGVTLLVESLSWNQLTAYMYVYLQSLHVPREEWPGWIAAFSSVGWLLALPMAPLWGVLADRYSRKLIIVRTSAVEAVIFAGWAFATAPWVALGFICLNGFILGNTGVMLAVQATTTPRQRLALAVGVVSAGSPAGRALGPILGALLVHLVDVRGMLLFDAALSAAIAVLLMLLVRESDHERPADVRILSLLRGAILEIKSRPLVWRLFLATTITSVGLLTVLPYTPVFITRMTAADKVTAVGVVLSTVGLAQAVASPLWGLVIARFGHIAVLSATSLGSCVSLVAGATTHWLPAFALALVANGVFMSAMLTASMALMAAEISPERRGAVLGQIMFPFYIGGVVGPLIGGIAFHAGQAAVFGIAAVLSLAPAVLLLSLRAAVPQTRPA